MTSESRFDRHLTLVTRMADALGVDLEADAFAGRLDPETLDAMVSACTGCSDAEGCRRILGAPGMRLRAAPSQCRNSDRLEGMRR